MANLTIAILNRMKKYFGADARRIRHAQNVLGYVRELLKKEKGDRDIVIAAAILHDIGIKECERKYNSTSGQLQEKEGPAIARKILEDLKVGQDTIREICQIIASHHSPGEIDTMNFKILWDSDWLVNLKDEYDIKDRKKLEDIIEKVFLTQTGRIKAKKIYLKDFTSHKVYLVGAGPGEPALITVKGLKILKQADVVIYDYLVDKRLLDEARPDAELICCDALGKKRHSDGFSHAQKLINNLIIKKAKDNKRVIRLKNGDPVIFSRLSQELDALSKENIEFEIVPGVTAASAAGGFTGVPLTDRNISSSVVFVTGHEALGKKQSALNWKAIAGCGTVVLYMAVENIKDIVTELIEQGKSEKTPVIAMSGISSLNQRIARGRLSNIAKLLKEKNIKSPAVFIIGDVVNFEKRFNRLRKNKRILFTGLSGERFFLKGTYFHLPLIRIEPLEDYSEFDNYIKTISDFGSRRTATSEVGKVFDWIVFSSRFGVEYFFKRLKELGLDARSLNNIKIAAIGNCTSERLLGFTISADLVPKKESSKGLIDEFRNMDIKGRKIFLPRSDISDKGLEKEFEKLGAIVTSSFAYRNVMARDLPDLDLNFFNEIMFTSPSGVRNFAARYGKPPKKVKISCIGDVTKKEAEKWGLSG